MSYGTKKEVDRLLWEAHKITMEVSHSEVTPEDKKETKKKCMSLYNQIKLLDSYTYNLLTKTLDDGNL